MTGMSSAPSYSLAVLLDSRRLDAIKGTGLENRLTSMFGGAIKAFILQVSAEQSKRLLEAFPRSRTDARGFIEELPVTYKRALFEEIVRRKSVGPEVTDSVLTKLSAIKTEAAKEEDYLRPPEGLTPDGQNAGGS